MADILASPWFPLVLGVVLGGIASWLITHVYHRKGSQEQAELFSKLSTEVRDAILNTPSKTLHTEELLKLLNEIKQEPIDASRIVGSIDGGTF